VNRDHGPRRHRAARRRSWPGALAWIPLVVLGLACGDDDGGRAPAPPADNARLNACGKLAGCSQCFIDQHGRCLAASACAERVSAEDAACINAVIGCDGSALGACLRFGCGGSGEGCEG
jgi:hypothetical protein